MRIFIEYTAMIKNLNYHIKKSYTWNDKNIYIYILRAYIRGKYVVKEKKVKNEKYAFKVEFVKAP